MEENEVQGANDPAISSRDKDRLFADEPRDPQKMDDAQRALAQHRAAVNETATPVQDGNAHNQNVTGSTAEPAEGMFAQPVPPRPQHNPYEQTAADSTVDEADYKVEEQNRKGESAHE